MSNEGNEDFDGNGDFDDMSKRDFEREFGNSYSYKDIGGGRGLLGIRKSPSSYLSSIFIRGVRQCINEIVQNSVDEGVAKLGYLTSNGVEITEDKKFHIYVEVKKDDSVSIKDNGRGVPPDFHPEFKGYTLEILFEELNIGGKGKNFVQKSDSAYVTPTIGKHGMGAACVNACCDYFDVVSRFQRDKKIFHARWEEAIKVQPMEEIGDITDDDFGTIVSFRPSDTVFKKFDESGNPVDRFYNFQWIDELLTEYAYNTANMVYHLSFEEEDGHVITKEYDSNLLTVPSRLQVGESDIYSIHFSLPEEQFQGNLFISSKGNHSQFSVVNMLRVNRGSHVKALERALENIEATFYPLIQAKVDEEKLGIVVDKANLRNLRVPSLTSFVGFYLTLYMEDPQYSGQTKSELEVPRLIQTLSTVITEEFSKLIDLQVELISTFGEKALNSIRSYVASEKRKEEEANKKQIDEIKREAKKKNKSTVVGANDDYTSFIRARALNTKDVIVYIVEGKTVFNLYKAIRYAQNESVYAFDHRPMNVYNHTLTELRKKEKFNDLFSLLLGDGGKSDYKAVVLATDFDPDGEYINLYLIAFILEYFPKIILQGRLLIFESYKFMATKGDLNVYDEEGNEVNPEVYTFKDRESAQEFVKTNPGFSIRSYKGTGSIPGNILRSALDNLDNYKRMKTNDIDATKELIKKLLTNSKYKQQTVLTKYGSDSLISLYANQRTVLKYQDIDFDVNKLGEEFSQKRDMTQTISHQFLSLTSDDEKYSERVMANESDLFEDDLLPFDEENDDI